LLKTNKEKGGRVGQEEGEKKDFRENKNAGKGHA